MVDRVGHRLVVQVARYKHLASIVLLQLHCGVNAILLFYISIKGCVLLVEQNMETSPLAIGNSWMFSPLAQTFYFLHYTMKPFKTSFFPPFLLPGSLISSQYLPIYKVKVSGRKKNIMLLHP